MTTLEWHGPLIMSGAAPSPALKGLSDEPGVYIYYQQYAGKTVAYMGQSKTLWSRIFEHIGCFARAKYWLRNETGMWAYAPKEGMIARNAEGYTKAKRPLADLPTLIQDNLNRLVFIWAPTTESLDNTEKSLIAMAQACDGITCDNDKPGSGETVPLTHNFDHIEGPVAPEILELLTQINKGSELPRRP